MALLENISVEQLHDALGEVETKKPTQRLQIAILYKQGPSVPMIVEWFDMRDDTIYRWLREMESEPLLEAIHDEPPPGRPSKLAEEFDIEYTPRHVRRLLKDAGLSFQTPRPQPPTADEDEREEFRKDLKTD